MAEPRKLFFSHIIRKVFLEDWGLKLVALLITLTLWFGVTGLSTPTTRRLTVPLNLSIAGNAQIVNNPQQDVEIEITGDKRLIDQIRSSELAASVDLTDTHAGNWVVSLSPDTTYVALPQGVRLTDVAPSRIAVNIETVEEKEVQVVPAITGRVPLAYEVYGTSVLPVRVRVRGPVSVIRGLDQVETEGIDVTSKTQDFTARQITIRPPDDKTAVLDTVVDVTFRIGERRIERTFTVPVSGEPGRSASFVLFGPRTLVQKARADDFRVEVFLDGGGELKPHLTLPAELQSKVEVRNLEFRPPSPANL